MSGLIWDGRLGVHGESGECAAQERRSYISRMAEAKSGVHEMYCTCTAFSSVRSSPRMCDTTAAKATVCDAEVVCDLAAP